ncbi:MAG TPA: hypothetical protein VKR53_19300 [Puia sp.]|nr:hypothetical protein [Puia sp.]
MLTIYSRGNTQKTADVLLPLFAMVMVFGCAAGSFILVFTAGKQSHSFLLRALFAVWVLMPYISMVVVFLVSRLWTHGDRKNLCRLISFLALGSLLAYMKLQGIAGTRPAFIFLVVPVLSAALLVCSVLALSKNRTTS